MRVLAGILICAVALLVGAAAFVYSGLYDTAATDQHSAPVYWILKTVMRRAIGHHAHGLQVPSLDDASRIARGRILFADHCTRCHGAPGFAPEAFALGMRPTPANLANTGIEWPQRDLFWAIKHGLKMTGMPGWEFRLSDDDIWTIVAYVQAMPYESPRAYRDALHASGHATPVQQAAAAATSEPEPVTGEATGIGDAKRGRHVIEQYACITCHEIPGVVGASVPVGPPLDRMGLRSFVGGVVTNTPQNMVRFLRAPQQFVPDGAMPNLGITERDARDIAAYLQSLR
jgi:mono/diheme cytochrome c family protein